MKKISDVVWEIPKSYKAGMLTPARIIATKKILQEMDEQVYEQLTNVATLPGLINHALCMPDGHSGYGFPIGGVAAMDAENGVISPGGIGFDINCGMRLVLTNLTADDVKPHLKKLVDELYLKVPAGVGSKGFVKLSHNEFKEAVEMGAKWCVEKGYGWEEDLRRIEEDGCMEGADSSKISIRSIQRGVDQIGTLGSGNHYLEIANYAAAEAGALFLQRKGGILEHGHVWPDGIGLEHHADVAPVGRHRGVPVGRKHHLAVDGHLARDRRLKPGEASERGGLAAAAGAQQGEELALGDGDVDAPHRMHAALVGFVLDVEILDADHGHRACVMSRPKPIRRSPMVRKNSTVISNTPMAATASMLPSSQRYQISTARTSLLGPSNRISGSPARRTLSSTT